MTALPMDSILYLSESEYMACLSSTNGSCTDAGKLTDCIICFDNASAIAVAFQCRDGLSLKHTKISNDCTMQHQMTASLQLQGSTRSALTPRRLPGGLPRLGCFPQGKVCGMSLLAITLPSVRVICC